MARRRRLLKPTTRERFSQRPPRMAPPMLEPKSTSGRVLSRNEVAKMTPAKKIGTKTTAQETTTRTWSGKARKYWTGTSAFTRRAATRQGVGGPEPAWFQGDHHEVACQDHHQNREEDDRIHDPGRAEQEGHMNNPFVSRSMNPAPRKNIWPLGRSVRTGAKSPRIASESTATINIPAG